MVLVVVVDVGHHTVSAHADQGRSVAVASRRLGGRGVVLGGGRVRVVEGVDPSVQLPLGWLERVGDRVPFHTPEGSVTGDELLAAVVRDPLRSVMEGLVTARTDELQVGLVVPGDWSAHRSAVARRIVREEVAVVWRELRGGSDGEDPVRVVPVPELEATAAVATGGLGPVGEREVSDDVEEVGEELEDVPAVPHGGPVLVIDAGATATRARVLVAGENSGGGALVVERSVGGDVLDDRVFRHVLDQLPPPLLAERGSDDSLRELRGLQQACRAAREELSSATDTTVAVRLTAAGSEVRLVRAELEDLVEPDLLRILEVGHRAVEEWSQARGQQPVGAAGGARLHRVVVLGGLARMPRLVQLASATWGLPVHRPRHPATARLSGASVVLRERLAGSSQARTRSAVAATQDTAPDGAAGARRQTQPVGRPVLPLLPTGGGTSPAGARPPLEVLTEDPGAHATRSVLGRPDRTNTILGAAAAVLLLAGAGATVAVLPGLVSPDGTVAQVASSTPTETVTRDPTARNADPSGRAGAGSAERPGNRTSGADGLADVGVRLVRAGGPSPEGAVAGGPLVAGGPPVGRTVAVPGPWSLTHLAGDPDMPAGSGPSASASSAEDGGPSATDPPVVAAPGADPATTPAAREPSTAPGPAANPPAPTTDPPTPTTDPPPPTTNPPTPTTNPPPPTTNPPPPVTDPPPPVTDPPPPATDPPPDSSEPAPEPAPTDPPEPSPDPPASTDPPPDPTEPAPDPGPAG